MKRLSLRNAFGAALLAGVVGLAVLLISSRDPGAALRAFVVIPFESQLFLGDFLEQAGLILLCALGFSISFRAGAFNLGGEGQLALGAITATLLALALPNLPAPIGIILGGTVAALSAGAVGGLVGVLKVRLQISEVISSFLIALALIPLADWAVSGPLRDASGSLLATPPVPAGYFLPPLLPPSQLSAGVFGSLGAAIITWVVLRHSLFGYDSRVISSSPEFGRSQGIPVGSRLILSLCLSAGFHGIAGATVVYGSYHATFSGIANGLGWAGIAAALLAKAHPLAAIPASLLLAYIAAGSRAAAVYSDLSFEIAGLMQGVFFLFITARTLGSRRA